MPFRINGAALRLEERHDDKGSQRKLSGVDVTADKNEVSAFVDSAKISSWAVDGVAYCTKSGLVKGNPGKVFAPAGNTTRAELATIIQRIAA